MWLDVEHRLHFSYETYVRESFVELRVEPRRSPVQTLHSFYLAVGPPTKVFRYVDWNGNRVHHFSIPDYHDRIEVVSRALVETRSSMRDPRSVSEPPQAGPDGALLDFLSFDGPVRQSARLVRLDEKLRTPSSGPLGDQVGEIGSVLHERFRYDQEVTDYRSTTDDFLEHEAGVCQDFAHLMLALLRRRRIVARYVSGYLHTELEEGSPSESHAWVEVLEPGGAWLAFDPTHDRTPDERYVTIAYGRHYDDVAPNRGIFRGNSSERLRAEVTTRVAAPQDVAALHEEIGRIELPVYREVPARRAEAVPGVPDQEDAQQQ